MLIFKRENTIPIVEKLGKGKIIILYGPRQVGKTTLCKEILKRHGKAKLISCDDLNVANSLESRSVESISKILGNNSLVVIDEAQRVDNIGITLKLISDSISEIQVIATGSSSFDLANKINEPLTGRNWKFFLFPLTIKELHWAKKLESNSDLSNRLIFGSYPEIVANPDKSKDLLKNLANDYLYRDILSYEGIRRPKVIFDLLRFLALNVGNEIAYNKIANSLSINRETVRSYINILEQAFIIFTLPPLAKNKSKEISRLNKIYFFDNGIRNALIDNFDSVENRQDVGALFENYFISEKMKEKMSKNLDKKMYFWRTKQGQEIDLIEEFRGGEEYKIYECKYQARQIKIPPMWEKEYNNYKATLIDRDNYKDCFLND